VPSLHQPEPGQSLEEGHIWPDVIITKTAHNNCYLASRNFYWNRMFL